MTNSEEITINLYNKYIVPNYGRFPIMPVKGDGSFLYDEDGTRYLDFTGGIAVNSLGHSNPHLIKAINNQSKKVWHVSNAFIIPEGEKLASKIKKQYNLKKKQHGAHFQSFRYCFLFFLVNDGSDLTFR